MKECKDCELAIYCYSDPSAWVFRTLQEMDEKKAEIAKCPNYLEIQEQRSRGASTS